MHEQHHEHLTTALQCCGLTAMQLPEVQSCGGSARVALQATTPNAAGMSGPLRSKVQKETLSTSVD
jgi:hypothetical protein